MSLHGAIIVLGNDLLGDDINRYWSIGARCDAAAAAWQQKVWGHIEEARKAALGKQAAEDARTHREEEISDRRLAAELGARIPPRQE